MSDNNNHNVDSDTVVTWLQRRAKDSPDEDAIVTYNAKMVRNSLTYSELYLLASRFARILKDGGFKKGEYVVSSLTTSVEEVVACLGVILAGGAYVAVEVFLNTGDTFLEVLNKTKTRYLITSKTEHDMVWSLMQSKTSANKVKDKIPFLHTTKDCRAPMLNYSLLLERSDSKDKDFLSILRQPRKSYACAETRPEDPCVVGTTASATSFVCLVAHTHRSALTQGLHNRSLLASDAKKYLILKPPTWITTFPGIVVVGPTLVKVDTWDGMFGEDTFAVAANVLEKEKVDNIFLLPSEIDSCKSKWSPRPYPIAEHLIVGGMPITAKVVDVAKKCFNKLTSIYASSECLFISSRPFTREDEYEDFDNGHPFKGVSVRVVDPDGRVLPAGETGCVQIKSETAFHRYLGQPIEDRNKKFTADGYFIAGDAGCLRPDGHLLVVGRNDDMILHNVWNIHPSWIENNIKNAPGVARVVVVPVPDETNFQNLCACIIKQSDANNLTAQAIKDYFCATYVSEEKDDLCPSHVLFFEKFPELRPGLVNRKELTTLATNLVQASK